jgi:hypothetical protein
MEEEDDMGSLQWEAEGANNLQRREFFFDLAGAGPNMNRGLAGGSWPGAANAAPPAARWNRNNPAPPAARFNRVPDGSTASSIRGSVSTNNSVAVFGRANRRTLE